MTRTRLVHPKATRLATALTAGLTLAFLTGCSLADVFSLNGKQSTVNVAGPVAQSQQNLFMVTVWVTTFIFIVVGAVLAYTQIKFRAKSEADEHATPPPEAHGNPLVEIGLIAASVLLLVIIAVPTIRGIWYTHDVPEDEKGNAIEITATGYQWWFKFEYPTEMIKLPNNAGETPVVTGNELVIPAGFPIRVQLRTTDVIHSFWVPKLAGKVDMIPNRGNFIWFKADKPGYYYGQCAEYCGDSHAIMRFRVIALSPAGYSKWLENQKLPARSVTAESLAAEAGVAHAEFASLKVGTGSALSASVEFDADPLAGWQMAQNHEAGEDATLIASGRKLFQEKTCIKCHSIRGHEGIGITGPDLTRVGARSTIAAGVLANTHEGMHAWIKNPDHFKPGNKMYYGIGGMTGYMVPNDKGEMVPNIVLDDQEIDALVAYLHSLK